MDSKSLSLIVFAALLWAINVSALRSNSANQPYWHGYPYPDPKGKSQPQQVFYQPSQSNGYPLSPSDYGSMQTQWVSSSPRDIYSSWGVDELTANPTPSAPNNVRRRSSRSRSPLALSLSFRSQLTYKLGSNRWLPAKTVIQ